MNIKKIEENFRRLPELIQLGFFAVVAIFITLAIVNTLMLFDRSYCLDSPHPRRYSGKCEEYYDGRWVEPPRRDSIYYYNGEGSRITR